MVAGKEEDMDYEDEWINKLAAIDDEHSKKYGLSTRDAERLLDKLTSTYAYKKCEKNCPVQTDRVTDCLRGNKNDRLSCQKDIENFKTCIDQSLYDAIRRDTKDVRPKDGKKESYSEAFERKY